jgi:predicted lipase
VDLLRDYNVTTITTTGHSLGGGLSTLCAYDVGCWLQKQWKDGQSPFKVTKAMPKVTCISFAAPRVGNAAFVEHFKGLGIKALRVVNKGDQVPELPGAGLDCIEH